MSCLDGVSGRVPYRRRPVDEPGAVLVLLHGFAASPHLYHRYGVRLAAQGMQLWALDGPGHGLSPARRDRFDVLDDLTEDAYRLVDTARRVTPDVPLVVGGHSVGGLVAVGLAVRHPDLFAGVVVSGAPLSAGPWGADVEALEAEALAPAWERLESELPVFPLPVLAVHGARDAVFPVAGVRAWLGRAPRLRLEVVDDAGHDVLHAPAPDRVADVLAAFAAEVAAADRAPVG